MEKVEHIIYSHCDPVAHMGMHAIEQLKTDWLANPLEKKSDNPIEVASLTILFILYLFNHNAYKTSEWLYDVSIIFFIFECKFVLCIEPFLPGQLK